MVSSRNGDKKCHATSWHGQPDELGERTGGRSERGNQVIALH